MCIGQETPHFSYLEYTPLLAFLHPSSSNLSPIGVAIMSPQRKSVHFQTTMNVSTAIILALLIFLSYNSPPTAAARDLAGELKSPPFAPKVSIPYPEAKGDVKAPGGNPSTYLPPPTPGVPPSSPQIATAMDLAGELKSPPFATKASVSYPEAKGYVKAHGGNPSTYLPPTPPGVPPSSY